MIPAYCINLDYKPENIKRIYNDWKEYLQIKRISATNGGRTGARLSHIKIFEECSKLKAPFYIIMEDDVYPTKAFTKNVWREILNFINNKNNKWDMITFDPLLNFGCSVIEDYSGPFLKIQNFRSMGMVIYNQDFFKNNIAKIRRYTWSLDGIITYDPDYIKLTYKNLLARQYTDKGSTTSGKKNTDYYNGWWDKTEKILQKHCTFKSPGTDAVNSISTFSYPAENDTDISSSCDTAAPTVDLKVNKPSSPSTPMKTLHIVKKISNIHLLKRKLI